MQTLQIDPQKAKKLYPSATKEFKEMLIDTFGEKHFIEKITDRVKTFEDACEVLGVVPQVVLPFGHLQKTTLTGDDLSIQSYAKLIIIARALNEGWTPDWPDHGQYKYYPWFTHKSGFGLSYRDYGRWCSHAGLGSRLCFKSSELAQYAGQQFESIYKDFLSL